MVEEILAQAEHHVLPDLGEAADEGRLEDPGERVDREIDDDVTGERSAVVALHPVVDRVLNDEQGGDGCRGGADADEGQEGGPRPASGEVARQPRETAASL